MKRERNAELRIFDPASGRPVKLSRLIDRLGMKAVAEKFGVTESAVRKWCRGARRPARRTVLRSGTRLL